MTKKGRELANKLAPIIGIPVNAQEICGLICRHATTYHRLQEEYCDGPKGIDSLIRRGLTIEEEYAIRDRAEAKRLRQEKCLENRITELIAQLDCELKVKFGGDPRGCTVTIILPVFLRQYADNWGRDGICVPGG